MAKIEKATLMDAPQIALMAEKVHEENNEKVSDEFRAQLLKGALDTTMSKTKMVLLATIEKHGKRKIIGMIGLVFNQHPIDGIAAVGDYLYVDPKYRSNGVTQQLLDTAFTEAAKLGATKAYTEGRLRVKDILEKAGFKVESLIMTKSLKPVKEDEAKK